MQRLRRSGRLGSVKQSSPREHQAAQDSKDGPHGTQGQQTGGDGRMDSAGGRQQQHIVGKGTEKDQPEAKHEGTTPSAAGGRAMRAETGSEQVSPARRPGARPGPLMRLQRTPGRSPARERVRDAGRGRHAPVGRGGAVPGRLRSRLGRHGGTAEEKEDTARLERGRGEMPTPRSRHHAAASPRLPAGRVQQRVPYRTRPVASGAAPVQSVKRPVHAQFHHDDEGHHGDSDEDDDDDGEEDEDGGEEEEESDDEDDMQRRKIKGMHGQRDGYQPLKDRAERRVGPGERGDSTREDEMGDGMYEKSGARALGTRDGTVQANETDEDTMLPGAMALPGDPMQGFDGLFDDLQPPDLKGIVDSAARRMGSLRLGKGARIAPVQEPADVFDTVATNANVARDAIKAARRQRRDALLAAASLNSRGATPEVGANVGAGVVNNSIAVKESDVPTRETRKSKRSKKGRGAEGNDGDSESDDAEADSRTKRAVYVDVEDCGGVLLRDLLSCPIAKRNPLARTVRRREKKEAERAALLQRQREEKQRQRDRHQREGAGDPGGAGSDCDDRSSHSSLDHSADCDRGAGSEGDDDDAEEDDDAGLGPRVQIRHGVAFIPRESTRLPVAPKAGDGTITYREEEDKYITCASFGRKRKPKWKATEVNRLLDLTAAHGTNFGALAVLLPGRSRIELKRRFALESGRQVRDPRVDIALEKDAALHQSHAEFGSKDREALRAQRREREEALLREVRLAMKAKGVTRAT